MSQTLEQYLRDELACNGSIDFSLRASVATDSVTFYIHPTNRAGMTVDFKVDGNTLRTPGGLFVGAAADVPLLPPMGTAEDLAASVAP
jgi:hypothetical protein